MPAKHEDPLIAQLIAHALDGGQAHADFDTATKNFPADARGKVPENLPYSAWQILEHLRITQRDILNCSPRHRPVVTTAMEWPKDYWPESAEPPNCAKPGISTIDCHPLRTSHEV